MKRFLGGVDALLKFFVRPNMSTVRDGLLRHGLAVPGVFRRKEDVLSYLSKPEYSDLEPIKSLLNLYHDEVDSHKSQLEPRAFPFIVFEGLDGAGKSRLTRETVKSLSGAAMSTPPEVLSSLRPFFDRQVDKTLRRAFYSLGNYIAERRVIDLLSKQPVVMDRFWHSTAASAISEIDGEHYPHEDNESWTWPIDLIRPDFVFFLEVSEAARMKRMSNRKTFSEDEEKLKADAQFRLRLTKTFTKMKDPKVIPIDCDPPPKVVLKNVLSHVKNNPEFVGLVS